MHPKEFLRVHGRSIRGREWHYGGVDNNQIPASDWDKSKVKILHVFLSPGESRAVSMTSHAVQHVLRDELGSDVFIDFGYFPLPDDYKTYMETETPVVFGNVSHRPPRDYDLLFVSMTTIAERFNLPIILKTAGIPMGYHGRMKDKDAPLVFLGGLSAVFCESMYGPFTDPETGIEDECLADLAYLGSAEDRLAQVVQLATTCIENKALSKEDILATLVTSFNNLYYPMGYEVEYGDGNEYSTAQIIRNERVKDWVPPFVSVHSPRSMEGTNLERKIINIDGSCSESVDLQISEGCSGAGSCYFCAEGWVMGAWREGSIPYMKKKMHEARLWAAPNCISLFSFNSNYHSKFKDLLLESALIYANASLITMRADEVGADKDTLAYAQLFGLKRISMAVEGLGTTLRNTFLNKNLNYGTLISAARDAFRLRLMELKFPMIITGYETKAFIDEGLKEIQELLDLRDEMGSSTSLRMNFTPLIYYDNTPLRSLERVTARNALEGNRTMGYFLQQVRDMDGIRIKFHGRGYGTFIEQMFLDGGRSITQSIINGSQVLGLVFFQSWTQRLFEPFIKELVENLDIDTFLAERPDNWIYPNHRIHTGLHGAMLESEANLKVGKSTDYCLKTHAIEKPTCHSGVLRKDYHLERGEVNLEKGLTPTILQTQASKTLDEVDPEKSKRFLALYKPAPPEGSEGSGCGTGSGCSTPAVEATKARIESKSVEGKSTEVKIIGKGEQTPLNPDRVKYGENFNDVHNRAAIFDPERDVMEYRGCNFCTTTNEKKNKVSRDITTSATVANIQEALAWNRPRQVIRIKAHIKPQHDYLNSSALTTMITSRFMQSAEADDSVDSLETVWHSINLQNSAFWSQKHGSKNWHSGTVIFDIHCREQYSIDSMRKLIPATNAKLTMCEVVGVYEVLDLADKIQKDDFIFYTFDTRSSMPKFLQKMSTWNKTIKVTMKTRGGLQLQEVKDRTLDEPAIFSGGQGVTGAFSIKALYNPFLMISTIMGWSLWKSLEMTHVATLFVGYEGDALCGCGKEHVMIDRFDGRQVLGRNCFTRKAATFAKQSSNRRRINESVSS